MKKLFNKAFILPAIFLIPIIIPIKTDAKVYTESRKTGEIFMITGTESLLSI